MVIVGTKCLVGGSQMESLLVVSATIDVDNRVTACAIPIVKCSRTKVCKNVSATVEKESPVAEGELKSDRSR